MPRGWVIMFIVCTYLWFLCFLKVFCTRSNRIWLIFKQIYVTHRWNPNNTTTANQSGSVSNGNKDVLHTSQIFKIGAHSQMQFSVVVQISSIPFWGRLLFIYSGYSQHIVSSTDRAASVQEYFQRYFTPQFCRICHTLIVTTSRLWQNKLFYYEFIIFSKIHFEFK